MRLNVAWLGAALLLAAEASAKCVERCKKNCLHSFVHSDLKERVYDDCEDYLAVTITAAASTITTAISLPKTSVVTEERTAYITLDRTTTASTQTNYLSETLMVEVQTSYTTETVYGTLTVDATPDSTPVARDLKHLHARNPPQDKPLPTYAYTCGSAEQYSIACSCIGVRPQTTTVSQPTVTETRTEYTPLPQTQVVVNNITNINYTPVTGTVEQTTYIATETTYKQTATTTSTIYIATVTSVIRNGAFDHGFEYWVETDDNEIDFSITKTGDHGSKYALETGEMYDNDLLEFYQDSLAIEGVTYECTYDIKFTNYYETVYSNGNTYVPYCHIYLNNDNSYTDWLPQDEASAGTWQTSTFQFTAVGGDRVWFDCASPQPESGDGSGPNKLFLDNIACVEI